MSTGSLSGLVDIVSTGFFQSLNLLPDIIPFPLTAYLLITCYQHCRLLRWKQFRKRSLQQVCLNHIYISILIRQIRLHYRRHFRQSCYLRRIGSVMPCKHLIAPCSLPHDHRIQHSMLPDALYHVFQAFSLIQPEWMIMKRMYFLNRNRYNPVHSH